MRTHGGDFYGEFGKQVLIFTYEVKATRGL
jgi:hypothetical protein